MDKNSFKKTVWVRIEKALYGKPMLFSLSNVLSKVRTKRMWVRRPHWCLWL